LQREADGRSPHLASGCADLRARKWSSGRPRRRECRCPARQGAEGRRECRKSSRMQFRRSSFILSRENARLSASAAISPRGIAPLVSPIAISLSLSLSLDSSAELSAIETSRKSGERAFPGNIQSLQTLLRISIHSFYLNHINVKAFSRTPRSLIALIAIKFDFHEFVFHLRYTRKRGRHSQQVSRIKSLSRDVACHVRSSRACSHPN